MAVDDMLSVAWRAQLGGHRKLREAMLTLAIGEAGPGAPWAERCRARLIEERPGHFLGAHPSLASAMADPRVGRAFRRLGEQYPAARVGLLRLRFEAMAGRYTGEVLPMGTLLDALIGPPAAADVRRDSPPAARPTLFVEDAPAVAGPTAEEKTVEAFYLAVLLAIAMLLASAREDRGRHAA